MQEGSVGFDLRTVHTPLTIPARLLIFYCLGLWIAAATVAIRLWIRLGFTSRGTTAALENAPGILATSEPQALVSAGNSFSEQQPEGGLRAWASLSTNEPFDSFLKVVRRADTEFRYRLDRLSIMLASLRYGMVFAAVFAFYVGGYDLSQNLSGFELPRSYGPAVLWAIRETGDLLGGACIVVLTVYAVYWHFSQRLVRRRNNWQHFVSRTLSE